MKMLLQLVWLPIVLLCIQKQLFPATAHFFFYVLSSLYFLLSALQIKAGYPRMYTGRFLHSRPTMAWWLVYMGYQLVPFLFEVGAMIDWTFTPTTLEFYDWLTYEMILNNLYIQEVDVVMRKESGRQRLRLCLIRCYS